MWAACQNRKFTKIVMKKGEFSKAKELIDQVNTFFLPNFCHFLL